VGYAPSSDLREAGSPRPARRRMGRRPSATHVLIGVVVILAFVLNLLVLQDRSSTTLVLVADQPLAPGSMLDPTSVRLVPVDSSFEGVDSLISEGEMSEYEGWILRRRVPSGGLLGPQDLAAPASMTGLRSMSLAVPLEHAAGGSLVAGDRVDVISVVEGTADYVAVGLEVIAVTDGGAGSIGSITAHHVVVAVEADQALRLAEALDTGSMELVRSTGSSPVEEPTDDDG
jgi:Flp pilus assembly protein CpaB